jgi:D-glycero-D-manno-heptose 1,7-bisphosphate phosphatase
MRYKCVFLDRDGVINQDKGYISKISDFKIYPGVGKAISLLNKKNYLVIIITNQSGIGRGLIKIKELKNIHNYLRKKIKKYGGKIDDIFYCPFHPEFGKGKYKKKSNDRKPGDGMIKKAIKKWKINTKTSFMIGDKISDKQAAKKAKIKFFYKKEKNLNTQIKNILK